MRDAAPEAVTLAICGDPEAGRTRVAAPEAVGFVMLGAPEADTLPTRLAEPADTIG